MQCNDQASYNGFSVDFAGGASAVLTNCIAHGTLLDTAHPTNGSGTGFYIGSETLLVGCISQFAAYHGFYVDPDATNIVFSGCSALKNGQHGFLLSGPDVTMTGCRAWFNSQETANTYNGITVLSIPSTVSRINVTGCTSNGSSQFAGYLENAMAPGASFVGTIVGCDFSGNASLGASTQGNSTMFLYNQTLIFGPARVAGTGNSASLGVYNANLGAQHDYRFWAKDDGSLSIADMSTGPTELIRFSEAGHTTLNLPNSAAGLASGEYWYDPAAANVVKRVP